VLVRAGMGDGDSYSCCDVVFGVDRWDGFVGGEEMVEPVLGPGWRRG
jgi:hypothetical protein